jgi:hypothetical protein|tara:strand:- start:232 stop:405 length:174 start_codon:yes stop_codon:yes gene_type:complete
MNERIEKRETERLTERMCVRMTKTERDVIKSYAFLSDVSEGKALRLLIGKFIRGEDG